MWNEVFEKSFAIQLHSVCRLPLKSKWQQRIVYLPFYLNSHDVRNLHDRKTQERNREHDDDSMKKFIC